MISEKLKQIQTLRDSIKKAEDELKDVIFSTIDKVAKTQVANKVGRFIHIVNFSDISGKVWSADYYMWEHNAETLKDKLKNKSGIECYDYIMNLPNTKTKMGNYEIEYLTNGPGLKMKMKYPCNNEYIDKLINELKSL